MGAKRVALLDPAKPLLPLGKTGTSDRQGCRGRGTGRGLPLRNGDNLGGRGTCEEKMALLFLSESQVRGLLDLDELLEALAEGFRAISSGTAVAPARNQVTVPGGGSSWPCPRGSPASTWR